MFNQGKIADIISFMLCCRVKSSVVDQFTATSQALRGCIPEEINLPAYINNRTLAPSAKPWSFRFLIFSPSRAYCMDVSLSRPDSWCMISASMSTGGGLNSIDTNLCLVLCFKSFRALWYPGL